jgi:tryptophan-rich sensory protein
MINKKNLSLFIRKFFLCLILCFGGGWLTGLLTQHGVKEWYPHLIKPYGTPPDIVFPIVWSILYISMAIALTLLWISETTGKRGAFLFFTVQLFFNFIWSWVFFYLQQPGYALIDIVLLWLSVLLTISFFWHHTRVGSCLLIPYLFWVTYAFYLNLFIWIYN